MLVKEMLGEFKIATENGRNDIKFESEKEVVVHRGDVVLVNVPKFEDGKERSIQTGTRTYLIMSNERNNAHSTIFTAVPTTSQKKKHLPTHVYLPKSIYNLNEDSTVLCEQVGAIAKVDIIKKYDVKIDEVKMREIENALMIQQGIKTNITKDKYIMDKLEKQLEVKIKNNFLNKLKSLGLDNSTLQELAIM